jgi:hypothetical protein
MRGIRGFASERRFLSVLASNPELLALLRASSVRVFSHVVKGGADGALLVTPSDPSQPPYFVLLSVKTGRDDMGWPARFHEHDDWVRTLGGLGINLAIGRVEETQLAHRPFIYKWIEVTPFVPSTSGGAPGPSAGGGPSPSGAPCAQCGAGLSSKWRMGPDGPFTLCSACGQRYSRHLAASLAASPRTRSAATE